MPADFAGTRVDLPPSEENDHNESNQNNPNDLENNPVLITQNYLEQLLRQQQQQQNQESDDNPFSNLLNPVDFGNPSSSVVQYLVEMTERQRKKQKEDLEKLLTPEEKTELQQNQFFVKQERKSKQNFGSLVANFGFLEILYFYTIDYSLFCLLCRLFILMMVRNVFLLKKRPLPLIVFSAMVFNFPSLFFSVIFHNGYSLLANFWGSKHSTSLLVVVLINLVVTIIDGLILYLNHLAKNPARILRELKNTTFIETESRNSHFSLLEALEKKIQNSKFSKTFDSANAEEKFQKMEITTKSKKIFSEFSGFFKKFYNYFSNSWKKFEKLYKNQNHVNSAQENDKLLKKDKSLSINENELEEDEEMEVELKEKNVSNKVEEP